MRLLPKTTTLAAAVERASQLAGWAAASDSLIDSDVFWARSTPTRPIPGPAVQPRRCWWHKPECNCGLCRAPSDAAGAVELDAVVQASPEQVADLRDWPGSQRMTARLRLPCSPVALSLDDVRESGLPALLLDFGESLLYLDGEIFEVDASLAPLRVGSHPVPLPAVILATS